MVRQPQRASVALFSLIIVLLVLVIVAAAGAAILVFSDRFTSSAGPWVSPLSAIKAGAINPALALRTLTDEHDQAIVERAIASGSSETALATLLYSTTLSDQSRTAGLLRLASLLAGDARNKDKAALTAHTAADVAILSPVMPDYSRAAMLAQAGQVLARLGRNDEALSIYSVAATIAQHSGRIDPSYRQIMLEGLADDVSRLGRKELAHELRAAVNGESPPPDNTPQVLTSLLVPLIPDDSAAWTELDDVTGQRVSMAAALVSALEGESPTPSETVRQSLEGLLVREDRLRERVSSAGIAQASNLLQRAAFARSRMEWLTLKWRVARQGFGMALVPAWERQEQEIEANLRQACQDYYAILRDVSISLPDQTSAVQGALDVIQDQIKMGRLGLPPSAQEGELVRALDQVERQYLSLGLGQTLVTVKTNTGSSQLTVVRSQ